MPNTPVHLRKPTQIVSIAIDKGFTQLLYERVDEDMVYKDNAMDLCYWPNWLSDE